MSQEDDLQKIVDRIPTRWGKYLSIGPGWYDIVIELDKDLSAIDPNYQVEQVKEKFGGLRYYCTPSTDFSLNTDNASKLQRFGELIMAAESLSEITCDVCGGPGTLGSIRGWYSTRCDDDKGKRIESFR